MRYIIIGLSLTTPRELSYIWCNVGCNYIKRREFDRQSVLKLAECGYTYSIRYEYNKYTEYLNFIHNSLFYWKIPSNLLHHLFSEFGQFFYLTVKPKKGNEDVCWCWDYIYSESDVFKIRENILIQTSKLNISVATLSSGR